MAVSNIKEDDIQGQILQAAKQLFQAHGFRKVTIDDVARAIGKARSSLYYYYKTKEEILDAVMAVEIRELLAAITRAVNDVQSTEQKISAFFATRLRILRERRAFYNTLDTGMDAEEMSTYKKAQYVIHKKIMEQEGDLLQQVITDGIRKGELRKMNKEDQQILIFVLLSSVRGLKREMVIENDFSGAEPAIRVLTQALIHGLKK